MSRIVLIDGHNILRKAFYSVPVMTDSTGFHTNAIYGFLNMMLKVVEEQHPQYLSVVFETDKHMFGNDVKVMPTGLQEQIPVLKEILSSMKINILEKAGVEAVDLMGTIAKRFMQEAENEIILVSGNQNVLQLASDHVKICMPKTGGGKTALITYTAKDVEETYQVTPVQFLASWALSQAAQIGEKTAIRLLSTYGSIESLYEHMDEVSEASIREKLSDNKDVVDSKKDLYTINTDVDIDFSKEKAKLASENLFTPEAGAKLKKLSLKNKFDQEMQENPIPEVNLDRDIKVVKIRTPEDAGNAFAAAVKAGNAALRMISVKSKGAGALGARADGQMFLQMGNEEEAFGCLLCGGSENDKNIYYIESGNEISETYIKEQIERMLLSDKMSVAVFDVKNDYKHMISAESDRNLSAYALTQHIFDCKIAAYLVNPLKNDYEITDVANEYLSIQLQKWSEKFGKTDFATAYRNNREECLSYLAKETYVLYQAKPLLEEALKQNNMDKLFRDLEMPLTYVLFDMEREGILVKPEELKVYGEALNGRIGELEKAIHAEAGEAFNINSPKQLGEILFEKMKLPEGKKTKTGYSTAAEVLEKLAPDYPIV
ncbi:MAG: DNA polymerase I, partial [Lachnospiraceae bacterium]|nr:DNA polymerase I [Lachnospiraceae bacterium]